RVSDTLSDSSLSESPRIRTRIAPKLDEHGGIPPECLLDRVLFGTQFTGQGRNGLGAMNKCAAQLLPEWSKGHEFGLVCDVRRGELDGGGVEAKAEAGVADPPAIDLAVEQAYAELVVIFVLGAADFPHVPAEVLDENGPEWARRPERWS